MGESDSANRAEDAVEKALNNPLLEVDIENATGALVNVIGGNDLALDEYRKIVETVGEHLSPEAKMISGAQISKDLQGSIRVMLIITGVKSPQISGERRPIEQLKQDDMKDEFGIDFIEE